MILIPLYSTGNESCIWKFTKVKSQKNPKYHQEKLDENMRG